jgi:hypothetical protein
MQYLLLIYEDEARFAKGLDPAEFAEYDAFGKKARCRYQVWPSAAAYQYRQNGPRARRQGAEHRRTLCRDQGTTRRLLPD